MRLESMTGMPMGQQSQELLLRQGARQLPERAAIERQAQLPSHLQQPQHSSNCATKNQERHSPDARMPRRSRLAAVRAPRELPTVTCR